MSSEYIRFAQREVRTGQKTLLETQLNILTSLKHLQTYKQTRNEELTLKIAVKNKLDEVQEALMLLDKALPQASIKLEKEHLMLQPSIKHHSLEDELETIRKKLEQLQ